jgi:hypothetical protein
MGVSFNCAAKMPTVVKEFLITAANIRTVVTKIFEKTKGALGKMHGASEL